MKITELLSESITSDLLYGLTKQIHDKYASDPVDACWHATRDLARLLKARKIHGTIVKGDYEAEWGPQQHHWIIVDDDIVLDPTVQQFDGEKIVFSTEDPEYEKYGEWEDSTDF